MAKPTLYLAPGDLTLAQLRAVYDGPHAIDLAETAWDAIRAARAIVTGVIESGGVAYGVNTGFGRLAKTRIDTSQLRELQRNLLLSHATGVGPLLDDAVVRLIMVLKVNSLARGYSGMRPEIVALLMAMVERGIYPAVPAKGSVGASGDLAPLAHLSLPLIGEGRVRVDGALLDSRPALEAAGLSPLVLEAKEGLALINGTQVSTALALKALFDATRNLDAAFVAGSMTVEAALGSRVPFDAEIHLIRGQKGQIEAARIYRELLGDSEIHKSHADCDRVQDPYSLRCQPQVMGACFDQMRRVAAGLEIEANAVSDNPLVFADRDLILSAGNFHAEPVAMAADNLALAIAEIGALSERRMALLIDSSLSELPAFLVEDAGLNSGFMIAQVTAAALASENKSLAHPASVDSLPTSANQEDHVSMATFAARRLTEMNDNTRYVLAVEMLAAAQGIDLRRPMRSNAVLEEAHATIRKAVSMWDRDRYFQPDLEAVAALIAAGAFGARVAAYIEGAA
ncbi:MAG: histidine ammonia-lyase [Alphaproteobacteria bacterium]|nr:histidine ammonia-lyase [Alphaproteobacteria bacterium]